MNELRYFQWLVGERKGEILIFDKVETDDGLVFVRFTDNSRMNEQFIAQLNEKSLTGKMMAEIDSPANSWKFQEEWVGEETGRTEIDWESQTKYDVPSITEIASDGKQLPVKRKIVHLIPPRPTAPRTSNFGIISNPPLPTPVQAPASIITALENKINLDDPVVIMLSKSKKVDHDVEMTMSIAMPSKSLYNVAEESFENGGKKVIEYIIQNIDVKDIKTALKIAITSMYQKKINE